jgi:XTP/dITP diphosphohydrolase
MPQPASTVIQRHLLISTRNAHKVDEIREILGSGFIISDLSALSEFPEVEETGATFQENAAIKALAASARFDGWVIADDSGLEVDALNGAPGVRSARFSGDSATDASNRALLLGKLLSVSGKDRSARFRCVIALARRGEILAHFSGSVEGVIIPQEKGTGGFGYDSLFVPEGHCETFAQLGANIKNTLSHRARALSELKHWPNWDAAQL